MINLCIHCRFCKWEKMDDGYGMPFCDNFENKQPPVLVNLQIGDKCFDPEATGCQLFELAVHNEYAATPAA